MTEQHRVTTYGGEIHRTWTGPYKTTTHWQLRCFGQFIADTSNERLAETFQRIVDALNLADSGEGETGHEHTWVDQYDGRVFQNLADASDNVIYQKCSGCDGTRTVRVVRR